MAITVMDIISIKQLRELRAAGFVVVHREPTQQMIKGSIRGQYPEERTQYENWHRMVGESIKEQNVEINKRFVMPKEEE